MCYFYRQYMYWSNYYKLAPLSSFSLLFLTYFEQFCCAQWTEFKVAFVSVPVGIHFFTTITNPVCLYLEMHPLMFEHCVSLSQASSDPLQFLRIHLQSDGYADFVQSKVAIITELGYTVKTITMATKKLISLKLLMSSFLF